MSVENNSQLRRERLEALSDTFKAAADLLVEAMDSDLKVRRKARAAMNEAQAAYFDGVATALGQQNSQLTKLTSELETANREVKELLDRSEELNKKLRAIADAASKATKLVEKAISLIT